MFNKNYRFEHNFSMQSGDTAQAANFNLMMFYHAGDPFYLYLWIPIAFTRVYFQLHWIGDCLIGAAIGLSVAYGCNLYYADIQQVLIQMVNTYFN